MKRFLRKGDTINLCVLMALCEETDGISLPSRSG